MLSLNILDLSLYRYIKSFKYINVMKTKRRLGKRRRQGHGEEGRRDEPESLMAAYRQCNSDILGRSCQKPITMYSEYGYTSMNHKTAKLEILAYFIENETLHSSVQKAFPKLLEILHKVYSSHLST